MQRGESAEPSVSSQSASRSSPYWRMVSSSRNRVPSQRCPRPPRATARPSPVTTSMTSSRSTGSPLQTSSIASSVQPPENTAMRAEQPLFGRVEQFVRPVDGGAQRRVPLDSAAPATRQHLESAVESLREFGGAERDHPAAASSMASGTPSRRWQISTTARELLSVSAKSAFTCRARSTKRLTASVVCQVDLSRRRERRLPSGGKCDQSVHRRPPGPHGWWPARRRRDTPVRSVSPVGRPRRPRARSCPAPAAAACWTASRAASPRAIVRSGGQAEHRGDRLRRRRRDRVPDASSTSHAPSRIARQHVGGDLECQARLADTTDAGDRDDPRCPRARPLPATLPLCAR